MKRVLKAALTWPLYAVAWVALQIPNLIFRFGYEHLVSFRYRNWRGETSVRNIIPKRFWIGSTEWHPRTGLMLTAYCIDKQALRDFAVRDIDVDTLAVVD